MKFSLGWLQNYITLTVSTEVLVERLTLSGTEVEHWETKGWVSDKVVVGEIRSFIPHPNADRLRVCRVFDGIEERQVVCGAKNFKEGDKAPVALPGARLPGDFVIKESKLRGEKSQGMMCSEKELNLAPESEGIFILPADAPVGKPLHELVKGDTFIDVEITPNRPDLCSYLGLARELAVIGCGTLKPLPGIPPLSIASNESPFSVHLEDTEAGPFYAATVLSNVKVAPSPQWLQDKIIATGHRPINNVVDITNFVLWETGHPLHAFDAAKLTGPTLHVRRAKAGETFAGLDDKSYTLSASDLVIADASGPVAIAGVLGGKPTGVSETTATIVLEAAWFAPSVVRAQARRLGIMTDSSYRFERRVDPATVLSARDRAIALLIELCGATVSAAPVVSGKPPVAQADISLRLSRIKSFLGAEIASDKIKSWFVSLGLQSVSETSDQQIWKAPTYRPDLKIEVDLLEEIARLNGMTSIPARVLVNPATPGAADLAFDRLNRLRHALAARGWNECLHDPFLDRKRVNESEALAVANPLNEEYTHLRPSLKASLLSAASRNLARGNASLRLFEIGRVFPAAAPDAVEPTHLGLLIAGEANTLSWHEGIRKADLFDLLGIKTLLTRWGIQETDVVCVESITQIEKRAFEIKAEVFYAEIRLDRWTTVTESLPRFESLAQFPSTRRDIAVVIGKNIPQADVRSVIDGVKIPVDLKVELFDVFEDSTGQKLDADKKSLAYALTYRANDRTLTDKEVNGWHDQIRSALQHKLSCSFREG